MATVVMIGIVSANLIADLLYSPSIHGFGTSKGSVAAARKLRLIAIDKESQRNSQAIRERT